MQDDSASQQTPQEHILPQLFCRHTGEECGSGSGKQRRSAVADEAGRSKETGFISQARPQKGSMHCRAAFHQHRADAGFA